MDRERAIQLQCEFSEGWLQFAAEHESEMMVVDWLEVFSLLSATLLINSTAEPDDAEMLLSQLGTFALDAYRRKRNGDFSNPIQ